MHCTDCRARIDVETDRHLIVTEQLVEPEMGLEGSDGRVYCETCMDPTVTTLARS